MRHDSEYKVVSDLHINAGTRRATDSMIPALQQRKAASPPLVTCSAKTVIRKSHAIASDTCITELSQLLADMNGSSRRVEACKPQRRLPTLVPLLLGVTLAALLQVKPFGFLFGNAHAHPQE